MINWLREGRFYLLTFFAIWVVIYSKKRNSKEKMTMFRAANCRIGKMAGVSVAVTVLMMTSSFSVANATGKSGIHLSASDGKFKFTVTSISCGTKSYSSADGFETATAQGVFCKVAMTVKNTGKQQQMLDDSSQYLYGRGGTQFSASSQADLYLNSNNMWTLTSLNPGLSISGFIYFDVPRHTNIGWMVVHDSMFSNGATISLKSLKIKA